MMFSMRGLETGHLIPDAPTMGLPYNGNPCTSFNALVADSTSLNTMNACPLLTMDLPTTISSTCP